MKNLKKGYKGYTKRSQQGLKCAMELKSGRGISPGCQTFAMDTFNTVNRQRKKLPSMTRPANMGPRR